MGATASLPRVRFDEPAEKAYQYRQLRRRTIRILKATRIEHATNAGATDGAVNDNIALRSAVDVLDNIPSVERLPPNYEVELLHVGLDAGFQYEPISYTWGDPSRSHSLRLKDGTSLFVTETLKTCLPYLIQTSKTGHLWIDQLCINQDDNLEKGHQVAMMGDIYKKGHQTLVWLGLEDESSLAVCAELELRDREPEGRSQEFRRSISSKESLRYIDALPHRFPVLCEQHTTPSPLAVKRPIDLYPYRGREPPFDVRNVLVCKLCLKAHIENIKSSMLAFFSRPWFLRAWVVQEAVLSSWNVFMVGGKTLSTMDLEEIPTILNDLGDNEGWYSMIDAPGRGMGCKGYRSLHQMINMRQDAPGTKDSEYSSIWSLLNHFRSTGIQATNPRDYIYAILGIYQQAGELFTPDYDLSIRDLFVMVTRILIDASHGSLGILASCDNVSRDFKYRLPSWAPDWTSVPSVKSWESREHIVSGRRWPLKNPTYASDPYSGLLQVQGKKLGTIRYISAFVPEQSFGHPTSTEVKQEYVIRRMFGQLDSIASELNAHRPSSAVKLRKGLMLWYLSLGVGSKPKQLMNNSEDICWTYGGDGPSTTLRYIAQMSYGRRFSIGEGDILGLVPRASVVGDEIWLLHGSLYQHVLRPVGDREYLLLGTCIWDWKRGPSYSNHCGEGWAEYKEEEIERIVLV